MLELRLAALATSDDATHAYIYIYMYLSIYLAGFLETAVLPKFILTGQNGFFLIIKPLTTADCSKTIHFCTFLSYLLSVAEVHA